MTSATATFFFHAPNTCSSGTSVHWHATSAHLSPQIEPAIGPFARVWLHSRYAQGADARDPEA